ncbi:hypothetical protein SDC9_153771 [bioreactor metagenome]|uniref:Uncharacterized protein n=1 Tax=bioreactor metagenome TaxID=1076179 RepID=A0A645EWW0_9ZZZZ
MTGLWVKAIIFIHWVDGKQLLKNEELTIEAHLFLTELANALHSFFGSKNGNNSNLFEIFKALFQFFDGCN